MEEYKCVHGKEGYCKICYRRFKYKNDPEYRKRQIEKKKEWLNKIRRTDPKRITEWQRNYRKRHPDTFMAAMIKSYSKKLFVVNREKFDRVLSELNRISQKEVEG